MAQITGTSGNDTLAGTAGDDILDGLAGMDTLQGLEGNDALNGGEGIDFLQGGPGDDRIDGGPGFDIADYRNAAGAVLVDLAAGQAIGEGADTLRGDAGSDTLDGGDNSRWFDLDFVDYQHLWDSVSVNLTTGVAQAGPDGVDTLIGIEGAFGGRGNDLLVGDDGVLNYFRGGPGDDTIDGGGGLDIVDYQFGNPTGGVTVDLGAGTASGGAGNDRLIGVESVRGTDFADLLIGSDGNDILRGNRGDDELRGGAGVDGADYGDASGSVFVDLEAGVASGAHGNDLLDGIENLIGSSHDDQLFGDAGDNAIRGGPGNDYIDGRAGQDTVSYLLATGPVQVDLAAGTSSGADGSDTLVSIEHVIGGVYDDRLMGDAGDNHLQGDDSTYGGSSNDTLFGGGGNDRLDGGAGTDTAIWAGPSFNYRLGYAEGSWTVTALSGAEGTDTLHGVERLQFAERTVFLDSRAHDGYDDLPDTLWHYFIVTFDAAPGVTYMDQLAEAWRAGISDKDIVEVYTTKPQFTELYPDDLDHQGLAEAMVARIVKDSASEESKAEAVTDIREALDIGWTVGEVLYTVAGNLAGKPLDDPQWGGTARQLLNQIEVAKYYTETMAQSTTEMSVLRSVIGPVTADVDVSSETALVALIGQGLLDGWAA